MKTRWLSVILPLALVAICFVGLRPTDDSNGTGEMPKPPAAGRGSPQLDKKPPVAMASDTPVFTDKDTHPPLGQFSPEMERLVQGIYAGIPLRVLVDDKERSYLFRPKQITADGFRISAGAKARHAAAFEVFEGRQLLADGRLGGMATLAVVNDTLSMACATAGADILIEQSADGKLVARTLLSRENGSTWGHWKCAADGRSAGTAIVSNDSTPPPVMDVEISLGAVASEEPEIAGARADHPYFRLGPHYDASLKDILVLMVSSKSRTGTNLSSRAATYFTYAATAADVYERQLGLRYLLQELVLIPSNSTEADIEPTINQAENGTDDLDALRTWAQTHRPQATYKWGHVAGWTLVDGNAGSKVGWAYLSSYGDSGLGFSVNEPEWTWGVLIHEIGHNIGANHTGGGAMNDTVSRSNPQESFFTENNTSGGGFTAAKEIYDYMSNPSRSFVTGPARLRHPNEQPFGVDDAVSTPADTTVTFNPLSNDQTATPLFGQTNTVLSLIEVGQAFPKSAGTTTMSGNQITFTPTPGFTGNVWFSYTLRGNIGNGGYGWMHSADVVVTVGGNSTNPSLTPALSTTNDVVEADFMGSIRINPLLNDEGRGRLWAGGVDAVISVNGTAQSYSDGAFRLVNATVISGNGTLTLETAEMTRNSANARSNTGYLVYTPGSNDLNQVVIQYTVADANGNQSTDTITINRVDPREIKASGVVIGTSGSYLNDPAWDKDEVFDGNLNTYYDAANATGDWAGLDLGSARQITRIKYAPRSGHQGRMVGGQFQGSNSASFSSGVVTFHTVPMSPWAGVLTDVAVTNTGTFRYVRYIGPTDGYCNVAEVEFYTEAAPAAPIGLVAMVEANGHISLDWADNSASDLTSYNIYRSTTAGTFGPTPAATRVTSNYTDTTAVNGSTYYYVVTAVDAENYESAKSNQVAVTPSVNQFAPVVSAGVDQTIVFNASAPWTPAALTPAGWYDATDAATLTQSSGSVSQWADKSGNGLHLTQGNATLQPRTGINTIGGLTAVKFDGSNDTLVSGSNPFAPTISDAMVIAVHRVDTTSTTGTLFNLSGTSASPGRWQAHVPFNGTLYFDAGSTSGGARLQASYGVSAGDSALVSFYNSSTQNIQQVHKNGALLAGDSTAITTSVVGNSITVGSSVGTQFQNTSIGELIMINGTVSTESRQNLEGYLAHKWGLASSLPVGHPYKSAAPGGAGVTVTLAGSASDPDGTTPAILWTRISGPGPVTFGNASAGNTTATMAAPGIYVLRLTANDGLFTTFDEVTVTVINDTNTNGIDDSWEMANFGRLLGGNEVMHESGVPHYFLYLHGTDLANSADRFRVGIESNVLGDPVLSWEVRNQFSLGTDYGVRISTNLTQWDLLPTEHYTLAQTPVGSRTRIELTLTHDYGGRVFLQLFKP